MRPPNRQRHDSSAHSTLVTANADSCRRPAGGVDPLESIERGRGVDFVRVLENPNPSGVVGSDVGGLTRGTVLTDDEAAEFDS